MKVLKISNKIQRIETELICFGSNSKLENEQRKLANKLAKKVKKMNNKYSVEDLESAWNESEKNMHSRFSSSAYKAINFKQWLESK